MKGYRTYWFNSKFFCYNGQEVIQITGDDLPMKEWLDMMVKYFKELE